jgi:ribosomal protein S18 acetylase RimI-like enzyme
MMMEISYEWRGQITDAEMVRLVESYHGNAEEGWWHRIRPHSLGWVAGRIRDGSLAGFVNVAWDGSDHAFLIDTKVRSDLQRQGIGENLVRLATEHAKTAGCEWLHVDYEEQLRPFYVNACGFRPTPAGVIHLTSL